MKTHIKFFPILFLFFFGCNRISLVESCVCDEMEDYCIVVEVRIDEDKTVFNNIKIDSLSQIRSLVSEARDNINVDTDRCRMAGKLYINKDCKFTTVNSVLSEFRKASFLKMFLKVNSVTDTCWLSFRMPLIDNFRDSVYQEIITMSHEEKDSTGLLFVEYYKIDTVYVNGKLLSKEEFANQIDSIIESEQWYHYLINPNMDKTFGEILSLADLYLTELGKMKKRYISSGKRPIFEYNDEAQLYYFEEKYSRKYSILFPN